MILKWNNKNWSRMWDLKYIFSKNLKSQPMLLLGPNIDGFPASLNAQDKISAKLEPIAKRTNTEAVPICFVCACVCLCAFVRIWSHSHLAQSTSMKVVNLQFESLSICKMCDFSAIECKWDMMPKKKRKIYEKIANSILYIFY